MSALDSQTISLFLSSNSSMPAQPVVGDIAGADLKTKYRPDKLLPRDQYFKWDLIYSGIDTPHRLTRGGVVDIVDRTWLATELNELKDFKI